MEPLYIKAVKAEESLATLTGYLAALPVVRGLVHNGPLAFTSPVTFFVGENGTGKSTLLEALAVCCGFNAEGGSINFNFATKETHSGLHEHLRLVRGVHRPQNGFFLRAESFYNVASEVERLDAIPARTPPISASYGGRSLHNQSHGESFMALVQHRFSGHGLYILDEPEAALSPTRQMALLAALHGYVQQGAQFLIATHSPVLMAYPGATIYTLGQAGLCPTRYEETEHYRVTRHFLNDPAGMLRHLLGDEEGDAL